MTWLCKLQVNSSIWMLSSYFYVHANSMASKGSISTSMHKHVVAWVVTIYKPASWFLMVDNGAQDSNGYVSWTIVVQGKKWIYIYDQYLRTIQIQDTQVP